MGATQPVPAGTSPSAVSGRAAPIGLVLGLVLAGLVLWLPGPRGLPPAGQRMAALFVLVLVFWATEAVPVAVTALLAVILQPALRIEEPRAAFTSFMSPVLFFVIASFFLVSAMTNTGLDRRFAVALLQRAGDEPRRVLLALMAGTAFLSTFMSDIPVCALFMAVALGLFEKAGLVPARPSARRP